VEYERSDPVVVPVLFVSRERSESTVVEGGEGTGREGCEGVKRVGNMGARGMSVSDELTEGTTVNQDGGRERRGEGEGHTKVFSN